MALGFPCCGQVQGEGVEVDDVVHSSLQAQAQSALAAVGQRLRTSHEVCRALTLTARYADGSSTTRSRTLPEATNHSPARTSTDLCESFALQRARLTQLSRAEQLGPAEHAHRQLPSTPRTTRLIRRDTPVAQQPQAPQALDEMAHHFQIRGRRERASPSTKYTTSLAGSSR
ncbi:hypothetical protein [Streptomyces sp. NPDC056938]|uniref:DinB/UmuC family translesion DNA polymerase n=1 Tax=unclassified Streptomyces TaxID=2593676 RepID=UPI003636EF6B